MDALLLAALLSVPVCAGELPAPPAADFLHAAGELAVPLPGAGAPLAMLEAQLHADAFRGRTPAATRLNVERFAARMGLGLASLDDPEAFAGVELVPEATGQTPMGRAQRFLLAQRARQALENNPAVAQATRDEDGVVRARFRQPLYSEAFTRLVGRLPAGLKVSGRRASAAPGLLATLVVPPGRDAASAAATLAAEHSAEVAACRPQPVPSPAPEP